MICRNHVDVAEGVQLCARCRMPYCGDCLVVLQGQRYCAVCKGEKLLDVQSGTDAYELRYATLGKRFAALWIDRMIFVGGAVILMVIMFVVMSSDDNNHGEEPLFGILVLAAAFYIGLTVYEALMLAARGQTLGKIALKIKVVRRDGSPISSGQAWGRSVIRAIMVSFLTFINYVPAFATKEKTCVHDLVANTRVVNVE